MPKFHDILTGWNIREQNLTAWGLSQKIAAESDPEEHQRRATQERWQRWLRGDALSTIEKMQTDLQTLGYTLKIEQDLDSTFWE